MTTDGVVHKPIFEEFEAAEGGFLAVLRFRLDKPDPKDPNEIISQDVEMWGRPEILGSVFHKDAVEVEGEIDENGILRASSILDETAGATIKPANNKPNFQSGPTPIGSHMVVRGRDAVQLVRRTTKNRLLQETRSVEWLNARLLDSSSGNARNVVMVGDPTISGTLYEDDIVDVHGAERDGILLAARLSKNGGSLSPIQQRRRLSSFRGALRVIGIALAVLFALAFIGWVALTILTTDLSTLLPG